MPESQYLYLLRHAKAEPWSPGVVDFERQLVSRGRQHMEELCAWMMAELTAPDIVLCSPAARARQTLEPFLKLWPAVPGIASYEPKIYEATTGDLQALAAAAFSRAQRVMIVGHNPGLENLAFRTLETAETGKPPRMAMGTLLVIELPGGWLSGEGQGRLLRCVQRKNLD